ncbi:hypothetical protein AB832_07685 [Flavobacteriaceae bacterium (ex Bugula neritina AB1)]|nr:hypothetical protein AB832_07685 [Flavobacteriaceae bacterium (ex Bugula neritina AB1)]
MERVIELREGFMEISLNEQTKELTIKTSEDIEVFEISQEDTEVLKSVIPGLGAGKLLMKIARAISRVIGERNDAK